MAPLACAGILLHANSRERMLDAGLRMTDAASALAFRPSVLAPTFPEEDVTPFHYFPINSYLVDDPGVDLDAWRLDVSGLVRHPDAYTLASIRDFPKVMQNTRHICIEGWDVHRQLRWHSG
jgi:DMSO/TMAO reductase YedYZ molybdopterin-dependent catalytic subunit